MSHTRLAVPETTLTPGRIEGQCSVLCAVTELEDGEKGTDPFPNNAESAVVCYLQKKEVSLFEPPPPSTGNGGHGHLMDASVPSMSMLSFYCDSK